MALCPRARRRWFACCQSLAGSRRLAIEPDDVYVLEADEQRDGSEVDRVTGRTAGGAMATVQLTPEGSPVCNYGFDVTPARLVTALITERSVCEASRDGLARLYPEHTRMICGP